MISAVLLLSAVSASFIGIGIAYKRVPGTMKGEDVMFWYSLFSLVLLLPAEFYSGSVSAIPIPWIICLLLTGNFNIFGMLLLQTAMKRGNSGIAWALTQSALIGPFLFGMVLTTFILFISIFEESFKFFETGDTRTWRSAILSHF